jgi:hypothetical protein
MDNSYYDSAANSYYDDGGYEDWCEANQSHILEQYVLSLKDGYDEDDLKAQIYLDHLQYKDVPEEFKETMFEEYLEHGGEQV